MACSETPAANAFLVDSLISSAAGRGEGGGGGGGGGVAVGGGGRGGGGSSYYPNNGGVYLPQAPDLPYGLQSYGLFPVLSKCSEDLPPPPPPPSMVPPPHTYMSGMEVWLDPPRSCSLEEPTSPQATSYCPRQCSCRLKEPSGIKNPKGHFLPFIAKKKVCAAGIPAAMEH
uniref:HOXA10 n=1 Tax=Naja naja TaxID=35670 RepID=A0A8C7E3W3_NAJNA